jgi:hypothetical protein
VFRNSTDILLDALQRPASLTHRRRRARVETLRSHRSDVTSQKESKLVFGSGTSHRPQWRVLRRATLVFAQGRIASSRWLRRVRWDP